jgi:hypothetical protein
MADKEISKKLETEFISSVHKFVNLILNNEYCKEMLIEAYKEKLPMETMVKQ